MTPFWELTKAEYESIEELHNASVVLLGLVQDHHQFCGPDDDECRAGWFCGDFDRHLTPNEHTFKMVDLTHSELGHLNQTVSNVEELMLKVQRSPWYGQHVS